MDTQKRCILIGAGDFQSDSTIEYNEQTDTVIAVDGGLLYCGMLKIEPDILIGDFDSVDEDMRKAVTIIELSYPEKVIRLKPEKDDTDMLVAIKWGLAAGFHEFHIYGGLGGRLDHSLANISCLLYLKHHQAEGYLFDKNNVIMVLADEEKSFQSTMEGTLSLFSMEAESIVTIENMKYPLSYYPVKNDFPIGISNEFITGKKANIRVHKGSVVILIDMQP